MKLLQHCPQAAQLMLASGGARRAEAMTHRFIHSPSPIFEGRTLGDFTAAYFMEKRAGFSEKAARELA